MYLLDRGKYLYHYTTFEIAKNYILSEKKLRLSPISNTNDPYEKNNYIFSTTYESGRDYSERYQGEYINIAQYIANDIKMGVKVLCFTEDEKNLSSPIYNIGMGFAKPRMWAQYAEKQKGVCLCINKEKLEKQLFNQYSSFYISKKVIYERPELFINKVCSATTIDIEDILSLDREELFEKMMDTYGDIYHFTKHVDWKEENEYRIIVKDLHTDFLYLDINTILDFIIIGEEVKESKIEEMEDLVNTFEYKPEIIKIEFWDGYYSIMPLEKNFKIDDTDNWFKTLNESLR